jgi:hypothetical protein
MSRRVTAHQPTGRGLHGRCPAAGGRTHCSERLARGDRCSAARRPNRVSHSRPVALRAVRYSGQGLLPPSPELVSFAHGISRECYDSSNNVPIIRTNICAGNDRFLTIPHHSPRFLAPPSPRVLGWAWGMVGNTYCQTAVVTVTSHL